MRGVCTTVSLTVACLSQCLIAPGQPLISIRFDSYADTSPDEAPPALFRIPPQEWRARYEAERIVYLPGEKAHITVEVAERDVVSRGQISLIFLVSGERRVLHRGRLTPGTYGPYEVPVSSDFEVYQVRVQAGGERRSKPFYGIRAWRGMKDFAGAVSPHGIHLGCGKSDGTDCPSETVWDKAVKEGETPLRAVDLKWAMGSHPGRTSVAREDWWLWTYYGCGPLNLRGGRTGLFWGEYNPAVQHVRPLATTSEASVRQDAGDSDLSHLGPDSCTTDTMLPNEIFFRERMQPILRAWAEALSQKHPGEPLTVFLGDGWGIGQGIAKRFDPEILRFFVSWMKEYPGITIEADTLKDLIQKCRRYPKHFEYFIARNTTYRSLELTVGAVRELVADSKAWEANGESNRQLIASPEAGELCEILSRHMAVGTSDDRLAFEFTHGRPLPYSLSNMIIKALAPEHSLCVGWNGCPRNATESEIYRWYLEPAWLTAYDRQGNLRHVYTHSPPSGDEGVWRALILDGVPSQRIHVYDKCFQLTEAIGVEKPIGPVFVCKDWTFADDSSGTAYRSDLYEAFLISLRRQKVPISCAVHVDSESSLPADLARVYAPRMSGDGNIRFGFRAGTHEEWFTCEASELPASLIADFASRVNSACGNPVVFPAGTSIEGYAFKAKGTIFVVAQEMAGRDERGRISVKVGEGRWRVLDVTAGKSLRCQHEAGRVVFDVSLSRNSAALLCLTRW